MKHLDIIHGPISIDEPVILELIATPAMQRLKGVDQAGYPEPFNPGSAHNRFDHSVGVFWLLRQYGASLEEQVAGLLHDVSHSAFSHCIDYAFGKGSTQQFQDDIHDTYVRSTTIPAILARYGFDLERILNDHNFPLKEQDLPNLCADRIDYSLRGALHLGEITSDEAQRILQGLTTHTGQWYFSDEELAKRYAELFYLLQTKYWGSLPNTVMLKAVGDFVGHALQQGYITQSDLYQTDAFVLAKTQPHLTTDSELQKKWRRMNNEVPFRHSFGEGTIVQAKSRVIDPLIEKAAALQPLSHLYPEWQAIIQANTQPVEYHLVFED